MKLLLASGSPRRRELLSRLGLPFEVVPSSVEEREPRPREDPVEYALELARAKAEAVAASHTEDVVLAADTVVVLGSQILNKPADAEDAVRMLEELRGQTHSVISAIAVQCRNADRHGVVEARVTMRQYSDRELREYVGTGEPMDKAGAYAVQAGGGRLVEKVEGCYEAVVGLPLCLTSRLLAECGLAVPAEFFECEAAKRESV